MRGLRLLRLETAHVVGMSASDLFTRAPKPATEPRHRRATYQAAEPESVATFRPFDREYVESTSAVRGLFYAGVFAAVGAATVGVLAWAASQLLAVLPW